jgi:glycine dehydrogenase
MGQIDLALLLPQDTFPRRHLGPRQTDFPEMLRLLGVETIDELVEQAVPARIRMDGELNLPPAVTETQALADLRRLADMNKVFQSHIGQGYYDCMVPAVIQRNVLENPGWYTQYTPYQAEIAQGRLEALLNFQTMVTDLTGMFIANASMLDEGTAAAEAMTLCLRGRPRKSEANTFFVSDTCHPQTIALIETRADPLGIDVVVGDHRSFEVTDAVFGAIVQYPATAGDIYVYDAFGAALHAAGAMLVVASDLLALTQLRPPGEFGADVVVGNTQRFGVPMGFGGPHAAFMATSEAHQRQLPGRLVGVSVDSTGKPALRLALQTREQHIRRERATSNICTAQVLLAVMASMYAVYHGPKGLKDIGRRVKQLTALLQAGIKALGYETNPQPVFDTVTFSGGPKSQEAIRAAALEASRNLTYYSEGQIGISLDETTVLSDIQDLLQILGQESETDIRTLAAAAEAEFDDTLARQSPYLGHPVFNSYHSETEMLRYIHRLQGRDLSLAFSMIPLGSCTMKLNATTEMAAVTWPEFGGLHPFAPSDQTVGYREMFDRLESALAELTGFSAISLQPNAGSQGEYSGLLVIRAYHRDRGDAHRDVCLIPASAHGTNPASAAMAGMRVVVVKTDDQGNVQVDDLREKAEKHTENLAALMITYPSTHGVYEESIREICDIIHKHGGQVYMDGANMNALVGLSRPGDFGADVCHLNLHKTFCIPHGGGGPGMGPIGVVAHLAPFLPGHPLVDEVGGEKAIGPVSAAPWGSPSILPISFSYIEMMGAQGLTDATKIAILNANYVAARLNDHFPVLYSGENGRIAHECIVELRHLKDFATVDDVVKRLMDYGFHAPTMSFPVPGTLMIEPTESESLAELDRFCEAMISIREEIRAVEEGRADADNNVLTGAPHTAETIAANFWARTYTREQAAYPAPWLREAKFWPFVSRIDNVYGDRNLFCVCPPIEAYEEAGD